MIRSETIAKAQARIPGGRAATDQLWTAAEWGDYWQDAIELVATSIIEADLPFYVVEDYTLTLDPVTQLYPLPADFQAMLWVEDEEDPIYPIDSLQDAKEDEQVGWMIVNNALKIFNFDSLPANLSIAYRKHPTEFTDWTGVADDPTVEPEAPLNTPRGARLLAKLIAVMAKAKDEALTEEDTAVMDSFITAFVDKLHGVQQMEQEIIR